MKKFYFSSLLLLSIIFMSALNGFAATPCQSVQLNYSDNSSMLIHIEGDMTTRFEDGNLLMQCSKGDIAVPVSKLKSFSFSTLPGSDKEWMGIESVFTESTTIVIDGSTLNINNLNPGSHVTITNMAGQTVKSITAGGNIEFSLNDLHKGIYVVTVNNKSLKIAVK